MKNGMLKSRVAKAHSGVIQDLLSLKFDQDQFLLSASSAKENQVKIWEVTKTVDLVRISNFHKDGVKCLCGVGDSTGIYCTGSWDSTIKFCSVAQPDECIATMKGHSEVVSCLNYNSFHDHVISGGFDKKICAFDVSKGGSSCESPLQTLELPGGGVRCVDSHRNMLVAICGSTVSILDMSNNFSVVRRWACKKPIYTCLLVPEKKTLILGDEQGVVSFWDTRGFKVRKPQTGNDGDSDDDGVVEGEDQSRGKNPSPESYWEKTLHQGYVHRVIRLEEDDETSPKFGFATCSRDKSVQVHHFEKTFVKTTKGKRAVNQITSKPLKFLGDLAEMLMPKTGTEIIEQFTPSGVLMKEKNWVFSICQLNLVSKKKAPETGKPASENDGSESKENDTKDIVTILMKRKKQLIDYQEKHQTSFTLNGDDLQFCDEDDLNFSRMLVLGNENQQQPKKDVPAHLLCCQSEVNDVYSGKLCVWPKESTKYDKERMFPSYWCETSVEDEKYLDEHVYGRRKQLAQHHKKVQKQKKKKSVDAEKKSKPVSIQVFESDLLRHDDAYDIMFREKKDSPSPSKSKEEEKKLSRGEQILADDMFRIRKIEHPYLLDYYGYVIFSDYKFGLVTEMYGNQPTFATPGNSLIQDKVKTPIREGRILESFTLMELLRYKMLESEGNSVKSKKKKFVPFFLSCKDHDVPEETGLKCDLFSSLLSTNVEKWFLVKKIVEAIVYLHSVEKMSMCESLDPCNVLMYPYSGIVKLRHYGMKKLKESVGRSTNTFRNGRIRFGSSAPECYSMKDEEEEQKEKEDREQKKDIFSLGMLMYSIVCGKLPFWNEKDDVQVMMLLLEGERPSLSFEDKEDELKVFEKIIGACLEDEPAKRPSASGVLGMMRDVEDDFLSSNVKNLKSFVGRQEKVYGVSDSSAFNHKQKEGASIYDEKISDTIRKMCVRNRFIEESLVCPVLKRIFVEPAYIEGSNINFEKRVMEKWLRKYNTHDIVSNMTFRPKEKKIFEDVPVKKFCREWKKIFPGALYCNEL